MTTQTYNAAHGGNGPVRVENNVIAFFYEGGEYIAATVERSYPYHWEVLNGDRAQWTGNGTVEGGWSRREAINAAAKRLAWRHAITADCDNVSPIVWIEAAPEGAV